MGEESSSEGIVEKKSARWLVQAGLFLLGFAATHGLFLALTVSNFLGFRGAPRESNPFARQDPMAADLMVLGIISLFVAVLSVYRRERKLASAFMYGTWLGVAISLGVIFFR
jgi:hypothetical protein